ncbi:hypothetical protein QTO34_000489 [Cnephaeus nilssonii]|uniref:dUTPase-like domain-containing protein n=1 Tax=Cnephaeus nilssonii TaxID=3371016 RepID=A0AA40IBI6_CNENI|nr:hypothetical protein QTO34_000489 [Eptesicus nilssonii]
MLWGTAERTQPTTGKSVQDLYRATSGSAGLDLCAASYTVLTPEMGVQALPTGVHGPLPPELILDCLDRYQKGMNRMPKVRGGFRRGLCASQEMGELVKGVRQLTLQERPYNLAQTTRTAAVPTWGQMKKLAVEAEQMLIQTSTPKTGVSMFLAMMAILSCQVPSVRGDIHWAYVPDPPLLHPAEWDGPSVPSLGLTKGPRVKSPPTHMHLKIS